MLSVAKHGPLVYEERQESDPVKKVAVKSRPPPPKHINMASNCHKQRILPFKSFERGHIS